MSKERECYECGKIKTALNRNSRCLTCVTERSEFNEQENNTLRFELAKVAVERDSLKLLIMECTQDGELDSRLFNAYISHAIANA
jgi:hypothetical protein